MSASIHFLHGTKCLLNTVHTLTNHLMTHFLEMFSYIFSMWTFRSLSRWSIRSSLVATTSQRTAFPLVDRFQSVLKDLYAKVILYCTYWDTPQASLDMAYCGEFKTVLEGVEFCKSFCKDGSCLWGGPSAQSVEVCIRPQSLEHVKSLDTWTGNFEMFAQVSECPSPHAARKMVFAFDLYKT